MDGMEDARHEEEIDDSKLEVPWLVFNFFLFGFSFYFLYREWEQLKSLGF